MLFPPDFIIFHHQKPTFPFPPFLLETKPVDWDIFFSKKRYLGLKTSVSELGSGCHLVNSDAILPEPGSRGSHCDLYQEITTTLAFDPT